MPEFILTASAAITQPPVTRDVTCLRPLPEAEILTLILADAAAAQAALARIGLDVPPVGGTQGSQDRRVLRPVAARAYLLGARPGDAETLRAAGLRHVDQSDYWVGMTLNGPRAVETLQRHWKPDLHPSRFAPGQTTRARLGVAPCLLLRDGMQDFTMLVPRSLARASFAELADTLHLLP